MPSYFYVNLKPKSMKKIILIAGLFLIPLLAVQSQTPADIANLLDAFDGPVQLTPSSPRPAAPSPADLSDQIKEIEQMMEEVRNTRQLENTAFQNFDQKANQLYQILSTLLKNIKEMQSAIVRNML